MATKTIKQKEVSKIEVKDAIETLIKEIRTLQLSNKMLLPELKSYWSGQWDGLVNLANRLEIKGVTKR